MHVQLKYQRVESELRQLAKTLPVGAKLPAERDLAVSFKCNFLTVRKALKELVDDGTVVRRIGSGTFITRHHGDGEFHEAGKQRIGVLVFHGSNSYAFRVLQAVAHAGLEQNVDLRSGWIRDFGDDAVAQAEQLRRQGCEALTLPWFPHENTQEVRAFLSRCSIPASLAMPVPGLESNCFIEPEVFGSNIAVQDVCQYFRSLGHRRIAFLGPDSATDVWLQKMLTGYVCYASRENLPSPSGLVPPGAHAMDQLAERWKTYRGELAIISYDDEHALRMMTAMHKIGFSAPEDYCIIGFNDTDASRYSDPPLTTVHQSYDYIGHWLVKSAVALAQGQVCQSSRLPRLRMLVRSTCGGRDKIDDAFRSQFQDLEIVLEQSGQSAEASYDEEGPRLEGIPAPLLPASSEPAATPAAAIPGEPQLLSSNGSR
jgi:DNA-binding LacI/PurR family transcriptional regulator